MPSRALPGPIVDLIHDGVPPADLTARGSAAVWSALLSTACSAVQHGWTRTDWAAEIRHPRSMLGRQLAVNRREQARPAHKVQHDLEEAWRKADEWTADHPAVTRDEIRQRIEFARNFACDPDAPIPDNDRRVIRHGCDVGTRNGTDRPTLPRQATAAATGLTEKAVRVSLDRLHKTGLMPCEIRGQPGGPRAKTRRASAYRLPSPRTVEVQPWGPSYLRETGLSAPPTTMWAPSPRAPSEDQALYVGPLPEGLTPEVLAQMVTPEFADRLRDLVRRRE